MVATPQQDLYNGSFGTTAIVVAIFTALTLYNAMDLFLRILFGFKRWRGVYFWSLVVAAISTAVYGVGYMLYYYHIGPTLVGAVLNNIGWIAMVCSQSTVLYSRLHLVLESQRVLNGILWMIVMNGTIFYILATTMQFGSFSARLQAFIAGSYVVEKLQMTIFSIQELIISAIYVRQIFRFFALAANPNRCRAIWHLLTVQALIMSLDVGLLVLEYMDELVYQVAFKGVCYSIKLKLEFAVLGDLIESVSRASHYGPMHESGSVRKSVNAQIMKQTVTQIERSDSTSGII